MACILLIFLTHIGFTAVYMIMSERQLITHAMHSLQECLCTT